MEHVSKTLTKYNNVINDSKYSVNNNVRSKYALDESKFKPNTPEGTFAIEIAHHFKDSDNFAFYMSTIKRKGVEAIRRLFLNIKEEIQLKKGTKYEIRYPKKYFAWKYKKGLY